MSVHKKLQEGSGGLQKLIRKGAPSAQVRQRRAAGDARNAEEMAGKRDYKLKAHKQLRGAKLTKARKKYPAATVKHIDQNVDRPVNTAIRKKYGKLRVDGPKGKLPESVHEKMMKEGYSTGQWAEATGKRVGKALKSTNKEPEVADNQRRRISKRLVGRANKREKVFGTNGNKPGYRAKTVAMQYAGGVKKGQKE